MVSVNGIWCVDGHSRLSAALLDSAAQVTLIDENAPRRVSAAHARTLWYIYICSLYAVWLCLCLRELLSYAIMYIGFGRSRMCAATEIAQDSASGNARALDVAIYGSDFLLKQQTHRHNRQSLYMPYRTQHQSTLSSKFTFISRVVSWCQ